jgi:hypothetical protein
MILSADGHRPYHLGNTDLKIRPPISRGAAARAGVNRLLTIRAPHQAVC